MTISYKPLALAALTLFGSSVSATELNTLEQRFSYVFGTRMARMLTAQGVTQLDAQAFSDGVTDALKGNLQMTPEQVQQTLQEKSELDQKERQSKAAENLEKGKAFRDENAKRKGVVVLDNGLQYEVLQAGSGDSPAADAKVKVHYRGTLIDGTEFDSSIARGQPAVFSLQGVVVGFREAITRMQPGAKWRVVMPPELAYGEREVGAKIGPNSTLVFEIELIEVMPKEAAPKPQS